MKCPQCKDNALVMSERQGIEIDYCPNCRGIWLDRGELDKLSEKAASGQSGLSQAPYKPLHTEIRAMKELCTVMIHDITTTNKNHG